MTGFQAEAKQLLEPTNDVNTIPELEVLQKCLERGATFGIDLPEIARLKLVSLVYFLLHFFPSRSRRR